MTLTIPATTVAGGAGTLPLGAITGVSVREDDALDVVQIWRASLRSLAGIDLPAPTVAATVAAGELRIELDPTVRSDSTLGVRADGAPPDVEAHRLHVSSSGVLLQAATPEGAHRALTTLQQLAVLGDGVVPCGTIDDAPDFAWRGLSLDVVRTFVPLDEVRRIIDMLSLYKLNVLHLHLTDNEAWRLQIESWPRLASREHYTQDEFQALVAYARERFVTVVPEIDLPGHSRAAIAAHPELGAGSDSPNLDPSSEHTWRFVQDIMCEVAALSPSPYVHIGGDEAFGMSDADHAEFVARTITIVQELGKRVVGWQEICRSSVGPDDVVQHWIDFADGFDGTLDLPADAPGDALPGLADYGPEVLEMIVEHFAKARGDVDRIIEKNVRVLLSPNAQLYLDRPHGDASTRSEQRALRSRLGLQVYPRTSLQEMFEWDPLHAVGGLDAGALAGLEAAVWCETVESMDDLELLVLPRLPGVAEAAWSASRRPTWSEHRARLGAHATMWRRAGWSWYHADTVDWAVD
jgi:hexosaminidase